MYDFIYSYPTKVFLGEGITEKKLQEVLPLLGDRIMVVYGGGSAVRNGSLDKVSRLIGESGRELIAFSGIMPNPVYSKIQEGAALARTKAVTGILALGGGSVIDACKIIALQASNSADVWEAEIHHTGTITAPSLPLGAIVTASGTGSEMNNGAVITNEEEKVKTGLWGEAPLFAFLDYDFMKTVPANQVLSGAFDTLCHAIETYLGTSSEHCVSDDLALAVMRNTVVNIERIIKDIHDKDARSELMWDSAMAENGILKIGRQTYFQAHMIEHQLGAYTDCNHGEGLAVIEPALCRMMIQEGAGKLSRFAETVMNVKGKSDEESAALGIDALEDLIRRMGLPLSFSKLRTRNHITDQMLEKVAESTVILKSGPILLGKDEILDLLRRCM